jgi:flavorubredoxin
MNMAILPKITIIYASKKGGTRHMAEAMAEGAKSIPGIKILLKDISYAVPEDVKDADAILLGGSTYDNSLAKCLDSFLREMEKMNLQGKIGVAFGSYASGEGSLNVATKLRSSGLRVISPCEDGTQKDKGLREFFMLGRSVAEGIRSSS